MEVAKAAFSERLFVPEKPLYALCIAAIVAGLFSLASLTMTDWGGDQGLRFESTGTPFVVRVIRVDGAATKSGIKAGDLVDARTMPFEVDHVPRNEIDRLSVVRDGHRLVFHVPRVRGTLRGWADWVAMLSNIWLACFAFLIAWRGRQWTWSRPLAAILAISALSDALWRCVTPVTTLTTALHLVANLPFTFVLLPWFFSTFGVPLTRTRIVWTRIAYAAAAVSAFAWYADYALEWMALIPISAPGVYFEVLEILLTSPILPALVCGVLAARAAAPADAQRVGWIVAAFGGSWLFWLLAGPLGIVWQHIGWNTFAFAWRLAAAANLVLPLVLSYAALSRRLFDIGFVINRTVVFGGVSAIVIGLFVLLEWAVGRWFEGASHATSLVLNGVLVLVLGVSLRFIHARVDAVVDGVFFRKRHENERALRRFAREAAFVTDREVLLQRTLTEIREHSEVSRASIILTPDLPANDPAVLAFLAWHEPVELSRCKTELSGEYAFPMFGHGELQGATICGPKINEERYAPDEIETFKELASGVGIALWSLKVTGGSDGAFVEILDELRSIRELLAGNGRVSAPVQQ
jgi:hypothetical protein